MPGRDDTTVGVDGCRGGWLACEPGGKLELFPRFSELLNHYPAQRLLVDIPIGLPDSFERSLEAQARRLLGRKASSVFSVPARAALTADRYGEACRINQRLQGRKLSLQTWHLVPKIREVDSALSASAGLRARVFESHPELCFHLLSAGKLVAPKKSAEGIEARLVLLESFTDGVRPHFDAALERWLRREVARDDILDAMVLALVGRLPVRLLEDACATDESGMPLRLVVPAVVH